MNTIIWLNDEQYWLYAAADSEANISSYSAFSTYTTGLAEILLSELRKKHDVETTVFLVNDD